MLNSKSQQLVAAQFVLFALLAISLLIFPSEQSTVLRVFGLLMAAFGGFIGLAAIRQHRGGPNVTPTPKQDAPLIETGLYEQIRHPIYTGVLLGALGLALFHGHVVPLVISLLFIPFFTYKSMYEETLLRQTYDEYADYMQRTGRFMPPLRSTATDDEADR